MKNWLNRYKLELIPPIIWNSFICKTGTSFIRWQRNILLRLKWMISCRKVI